jgi:hydrogenase expression/formation protein HypD
MEVCGGHTHAIFRYGIEQMLPPSVELVHGPGCPVCVLPRSRVDECVALAERPEVILATFGDAMRVPGSRGSLLQARAAGADVRMVYSPLDALALARRHPEREIVFFALGFETTMPATAFTVLQAAAEGIGNFSVLCNHITIVPTLEALLESPDLALDGFLGPGHVSMVIGSGPYDFIAARYGKPVVISGFEPLDILQSIWMLLRQLAEGRCAVENQYQRVVADAGNAPAQAAVERVFRVRETCEWRGLGHIERSGVALREAYGAFDAERRHAIAGAPVPDPPECRCGDVLRGALRPRACPAFATTCTPETPIGSLMVSSEGACAAVYQYGGLSPAATT